MAADVTIPRLGWSMEEGVFAGRLKQPGDTVKPGEPLFLLEGEKATQEIEAVDGGVLHLAPDAPAAGQTVLVGRTIGRLCAAGEKPTWDEAASAAASGPTPGNGRHAPPPPIPAAASPSVRRLARRMGIDLATVTPRLPGGRVSVEDLPPPGPHPGKTGPAGNMGPAAIAVANGASPSAPSSPRARRLARQRGIDITAVRGGGTGGRVRERDVLAAAAPRPAADAHVTGPPGATTVPITQIRRTIARQMVRHRQETVPVTLTAWADATALLAAADMQGGVFTLTSLGSYGIEFFTPVINHPEAAILGVGAIRMQPVPHPGGREGFVLRRQLPLSLTFDHRIVDGGPAARFLGDLAGRIAAFTVPSAPAASA